MPNLIAEYKHGIVDPLRLPWIETNDCMKMLQLPCSHFIVVYAAVFIYWNLTCFVCVATCCVFFLTHSRKCRFCLHWNFVVMRVSIALVQGLLMILWRVSFYSVKLCLLFVLHICLQLNQADLQCFSGKGAFFFLKGKLKITAEYWKPVKYLESIWRLS